MFILLPLVLTGLAAIGLPQIEYEDDFFNMWLPKDNYYRLDSGIVANFKKIKHFDFRCMFNFQSGIMKCGRH